MSPMRRPLFVLIAAVAVAGAIPVLALNEASVDGPAAVVEPAVRIPGPAGPDVDVVTIYNSGELRSDVASRATVAAEAAGGTAAIGRSASIGMQRVRRRGAIVQQAPSGYAFPMGTTILPTHVVSNIMGLNVAAKLTATDIVMSEQTASLRGAQAGDVVDLVASNGSVLGFTVADVVPDVITGGTELLVSLAAGDRLGVARESRVVLWGFESRAAVHAELVRQNLISTSVRIRRSWDPPDPDDTLGMTQTKVALGEFAYRVNSSGSVSLDSTWKNANITSGSIGRLLLQTGCHREVRVALADAMNEVISSGLENTINYYDANRAGGCFLARFNRLTPNSSVGFLSRHSWGMAVDTNTVGSCQGCAPPDFATKTGGCDVIRIFRKHGFAWGGNFLTPDGMHFEWVGQRRDIGLYPSRFCPNTTAATSAALGAETERSSLFANDGLAVGVD